MKFICNHCGRPFDHLYPFKWESVNTETEIALCKLCYATLWQFLNCYIRIGAPEDALECDIDMGEE